MSGRRRRFFRGALPGRGYLEEIDEELRFHLDSRIAELVAAGVDPATARRRAMARFGDLGRWRDECRRLGRRRDRRDRRVEWLGALRQDLALAWRQLRLAPGFALPALATLALGIGATTAIFSVVWAVVLRPLPYPEQERLVDVWERSGFARNGDNLGDDRADASAGNFTDWHRASRSFTALAATRGGSFNLSGDADPERVIGLRVTAGFFDVFGVAPALGRTFVPEEDEPGADRVAVLGDGLWRRRFGADPGIVGEAVPINGELHTVVGVMPPDFNHAANPEELWVPMAFTREHRAMHDEHTYLVVGRLAPGVAPGEAEAELTAISERVKRGLTGVEADQVRPARVTPMLDDVVGDAPRRLWTLLGAVGLVLAIACGNVANLLLARGARRGREMAVRAALGARRGRLVRQLLTESLLLATAGGALGVGLAVVGVRALVAFAPPGVPRLELAGIDGAALGFACAVALVAGVAAGLAPALRAARVTPGDALAGGNRGGVEGGGRDRVRGALVAVEVAFALALLAGAGLLIRSGLALGRVDPGFEPEGVLSARLALPAEGYPDAPRVRDAFYRLVEDLRAAPGVEEVALVNQVPLGGGAGTNGLLPEGRPLDPSNLILGNFRLVTPEYFRTLGIPLLAGRGFGPGDRAGTPRVMLVNQTLAREAFPGTPAIGRRIACCEEPVDGRPPWKEIVGVVGDVHGFGLDQPDRPTFYLPLGQEPPGAWSWLQRTMLVVVRGHGDPAALTGTLRAAVRRLDPELPIYDVATLDQRLGASLARERFNTLLLSALGGLGIVLAAVGIYGVIAYWVGRRTREIGVRLALGASRGRVLALVLRQTAGPVVAGLALGLALAAGGSRLLASQLYGVPPGDPATLAGVTAALAAAALTAAWLPARRALAVDPSRALRVG